MTTLLRSKNDFFAEVDGRRFKTAGRFKNYVVLMGYANRVFKCRKGGETMGIVVSRFREAEGLLDTPKYYGFKFVEWTGK